MKVNKHGDLIKKRTHKFKCYNCGCKYTANTGEWKYCNEYGNPSDKPTDYVSCDCPECGKSTRIQWRGNVRDWWRSNCVVIFLVIALLSFLSVLVFAILDKAIPTVISIVVLAICVSIVRFLIN